MKKQKLLAKVLAAPHNTSFKDAQSLVVAYGFRLVRIKGSHHIYAHPDLDKLINLQAAKGQAKAYQIREFIALVEMYNLKLQDDEESP